MREPSFDCKRALDIDFEEDILTGGQAILDWRDGRALELAVHLEPFQESARIPKPFELSSSDEVVIDPIDFPAARRSGGGRHRPCERTVPLEQCASEGPLADA